MGDLSIRDVLAKSEALSQDNGLVDVGVRLFEFVQFLLDEDENLTAAGNLNGKARERLRERLDELLTATTLPETVTAEPEGEGSP
jgi:hypothetical protein